jgi:hypothetical protein
MLSFVPFGPPVPRTDGLQRGIYIYSFASDNGNRFSDGRLRSLGSLLLPAIDENTFSSRVVLFRNPITSGPALGQEYAPFYVSRNDRVYALRIELASTHNLEDRAILTHCIPSALIDSYANQMETAVLRNSQPLSISWASWGPTGSYLLVKAVADSNRIGDDRGNYPSRLYGSRLASCMVENASDGERILRITIRDFSQKGFRHSIHSGGRYADGWSYHFGGNDASNPALEMVEHMLELDVPIMTGLPYRSTSRVLRLPAGTDPTRCTINLAEDSLAIICDDVCPSKNGLSIS